MCGGDEPETRMGKLCVKFYNSGDFYDKKGDYRTVTAQEMADYLGTSPQIAGKIFEIYDDMWRRVVVKGKIAYEPKGWENWGFQGD
jgi:hypothetical protein